MTELLTPLQSLGLLGVMLTITLAVIAYLYKANSSATTRFINYLEAGKKASDARDAEFTQSIREHERQAADRNMETLKVLSAIAMTLTLHDQRTVINWETITHTSKQTDDSMRDVASSLAGILENIRKLNGA